MWWQISKVINFEIIMKINKKALVIKTKMDHHHLRQAMIRFVCKTWKSPFCEVTDDGMSCYEDFGIWKKNGEKMAKLVYGNQECTVIHQDLDEDSILKAFNKEV